MKTKFWPPQFFNGQRGCGCCQPPPPPPPPPRNLYYYYGTSRQQRGVCKGFCERYTGDLPHLLPGAPRLWLLEVDGFYSVTSPESPCESSSATICENANGSFLLDYYDRESDAINIPVERKEDWWPYSPLGYTAIYAVCFWRSPQFVGIDKVGLYPIPGVSPPSCATCRTAFCYYQMGLVSQFIYIDEGDGGLGDLIERSYDVNLWLYAIGEQLETRMTVRWNAPDNLDTLSDELQDVLFDCETENILDLTEADWGYGFHNELMLDSPLCCSGAPNNVSVQPL